MTQAEEIDELRQRVHRLELGLHMEHPNYPAFPTNAPQTLAQAATMPWPHIPCTLDEIHGEKQ